MLKLDHFEHLVADLLFTHKQFLLHGNLHKRVTTSAYQRNIETWSTLLRSLEFGILLGLERILEKDDYFGRPFTTTELNEIAKKIKNIRKKFIAHIDPSVVANRKSFLEQNHLTGSDLIQMITALKKRALEYEIAHKANTDVSGWFVNATRNSMTDLDNWLKSFQEPL